MKSSSFNLFPSSSSESYSDNLLLLIASVKDDTHSTLWNSSSQFFSELVTKLQSMGYIVKFSSLDGFNPSTPNYSAVILLAPAMLYSNTETQILGEYISSGGKLIICGEAGGYGVNDKLNTLSDDLGLGIGFNLDVVVDNGLGHYYNSYYSPIISDFVPHPTTEGLEDNVVLDNSCSLSVDPTHSMAIAYASSSAYTEPQVPTSRNLKNGNIIVSAVTEISQGKVVVIGDANVFVDSCINLFANMRFFENIINW